MCGGIKIQFTPLICSSDLHTLPLVVGLRLKLKSWFSLVNVAGTWIYALKISERACSHKASSVHSLFDFCSSSPNLTLKREHTSPIWESVPVCKGENEKANNWESMRERLRMSLQGEKTKTINKENCTSRPPLFLQHTNLAPPGEADRGRRSQAD